VDCRRTLPLLQMAGKQEAETGGEREKRSKSSQRLAGNKDDYSETILVI